ncbi:MAG: hypothetical protein M0C28_12090 [Candidatus Moduliflexus flocculans]|nr:hypothetical protein [Candidatus Moduliflexus flocculans]
MSIFVCPTLLYKSKEADYQKNKGCCKQDVTVNLPDWNPGRENRDMLVHENNGNNQAYTLPMKKSNPVPPKYEEKKHDGKRQGQYKDRFATSLQD